MAEQEQIKKKKVYTPDEMKKAAYALNMCTVSVSQIVDYNDEYILEQEYNAILNNLNLEEMPKDQALLDILTELLNVITFFRIQAKRKAMVEKNYQQRMSNAIWSAIPNIGVIVTSGNPIAIANSLATQVGIGYMNYRREKADANTDKEKELFELEISAIEQFNAIRRELFTTAWRLADEYGFPDEYRLTERQIEQYNAILMDNDDIRKYERLDAIKDNFKAYPPFWYFFGHTANYIAFNKELNLSDKTRKTFIYKAKVHFEEYNKLNQLSVLREDQIAASCYLELVDLFFKNALPVVNKEQIKCYIQEAVKKSGNAKDVLQLCAIDCLKIGDIENAEKLLRILVNENYNKTTNAKLLSRLYVSELLYPTENSRSKDDIIAEHDLLSTRVDKDYLFPLPLEGQTDGVLQQEYLVKQKNNLQDEFLMSMRAFTRKYIIKTNRLISVTPDGTQYKDSYYEDTPLAVQQRDYNAQNVFMRNPEVGIEQLTAADIRRNYIDLLNDMLLQLDTLSFFKNCSVSIKLQLVQSIKNKVRNRREQLNSIVNKLENYQFNFEDYKKLQEIFDLKEIVYSFMKGFKLSALKQISESSSMPELDRTELEIIQFCDRENLQVLHDRLNNDNDEEDIESKYLSIDLLGSEVAKNIRHQDNQQKEMLEICKKYEGNLISEISKVSFIIKGNETFKKYFESELLNGQRYENEAIAIIDDKSKDNNDLLLLRDGFAFVKQGEIGKICPYETPTSGINSSLYFPRADKSWENNSTNYTCLINLFKNLQQICL